MSKKITALTAIETVDLADVIPIVDLTNPATTKKATVQQIVDLATGATPGGGIFGEDLAHFWGGAYDDGTGTWTDDAGSEDADNSAAGIPAEATVNGHTYPNFDGVNDSLTAGVVTTLDGLNSYCIFGCFNAGTNAFGSILEQALQFGVQFASQKVISFVNSGSGGDFMQSTSSINDGAWHRFMVNVDAGAASLYIDGVLEDTSTYTAVGASALNDLRFGVSGSGVFYDGGATALGIATRAATLEELLVLDAVLANWVDTGITTPLPVDSGGTGLVEADLSGGAGQSLVVNGSEDGFELGNPPAVPPGACTLEQFGAVGDGATDDSAALTAALAAMGAGTYGTLFLGAKTYLVPTGGAVPGGCAIVGHGHSSVLKTNANAPVLTVGAVNDIVLKDFKILGDGAVATSQIGVKMGVAGVANSGPQRITLEGILVDSIWQAGFFYVNNPLLGYQGPIFLACRTYDCGEYGFYFAEAGEYASLVGCKSTACEVGIYIGAGNINCNGAVFTANHWNVQVAAGFNDAHGIFQGCQLNHGTGKNLVIGAITNGHLFVGCNIYDSTIELTTSIGVEFRDCTIDVNEYVFNGSTGTQFSDCVFDDVYTNTVTDNSGGNNSSTTWVNCRTLAGGVPSFVASRVQLAYTFSSDANKTLTIQESTAETVIIASGTLTATRDLTINVSPTDAKSRRWHFVNNNGQTVNVKFTSGAAVAVTTGARMVIGSDGTDAVRIL